MQNIVLQSLKKPCKFYKILFVAINESKRKMANIEQEQLYIVKKIYYQFFELKIRQRKTQLWVKIFYRNVFLKKCNNVFIFTAFFNRIIIKTSNLDFDLFSNVPSYHFKSTNFIQNLTFSLSIYIYSKPKYYITDIINILKYFITHLLQHFHYFLLLIGTILCLKMRIENY